MDFEFLVPRINLVLGLVGFMWLLFRTSKRWTEYPHEIQLLLTLTLTLYFGLLSVSAQMLVIEDVPYAAAATITAVKLYSLFVLWKTRGTKYRTGTRTADGNPGADQNKDVQ